MDPFALWLQVPLYTSLMKFDCGCGWPGFWTNVKDAVYEQRDADGRRCSGREVFFFDIEIARVELDYYIYIYVNCIV